MTTFMVNIAEAKARLSEFLDAVARGERVVISKRNRPVAELRPIAGARETPRPVEGARGRFEVPDAFFEPLPEDLLGAFEGVADHSSGAARVAEPVPPPYKGRRTGRTRRSR